MINNKQVLAISSSIILSLAILTIALPLQSESSTSDIAKFGGFFIIDHKDIKGDLITRHISENLVTNEGMECVADLLFGTTDCTGEALFQYVGVGTDGTAPVDADTALGTESAGCARVQDAAVAVDAAVTGQRNFTLSVVFSGGTCEGEAYQEGGIFDAATTGNMLATATFPSTTLGVGETLTITYNVTAKNT